MSSDFILCSWLAHPELSGPGPAIPREGSRLLSPWVSLPSASPGGPQSVPGRNHLWGWSEQP